MQLVQGKLPSQVNYRSISVLLADFLHLGPVSRRIPQWIALSELDKGGNVVCTQPRRLAAISVTKRVSEEMGLRMAKVWFDSNGERQTMDGSFFHLSVFEGLLYTTEFEPGEVAYKVRFEDVTTSLTRLR